MDPDARSQPDGSQLDAIFEALRRINLVISESESSEAMLSAVLEELLELFACDRAWLLYPCTLDAEWWGIPVERTRPEWPGARAAGHTKIPVSTDSREIFEACLASSAPVVCAPGVGPTEFPNATSERFGIRSQLVMALHPKGDKPWLLGIHHCERERSYERDAALFEAIGGRLADALSAVVATRVLRESEARFRALVEHAPEAIVLLDVDRGVFTDANPGAEQLFGRSREELVDRLGPAELSPTLQPDGRPSAEAAMEHIRSALEGNVSPFEWVHVNAQGLEIPCEVRLLELPDPDRTLLRGSMTDISARKQAERERQELQARLVQSQKMEAIGQLTGGVAHDFNNLLTVILGNLDLAMLHLRDPERARAKLLQAVEGAERAAALTHRLLAFARRQPLRPEPVDAGRLLRGMDELLRRTLGEPVDLQIVVGGGLWTCEVDPAQLESAILNLALNARDAMPDGGKLTIEVGNTRLDPEYALDHEEVAPGQYVCLAVSDDGVGIPPESLASVFSPFFTTKEVGKGSGLGLSMVYGFVKQSGGHVKAYSEPGVGTTMKMYLPRSFGPAPTADAPTPTRSVEEGRGEHVLLVEDADDVRVLTRALLVELGYRVLDAGDARAAIAVLREHPEIELLLTDVILPGGMNGAQLAKEARTIRPDLRVLYMSGYTENAILHNGRLDADVTLLEKPFNKRTLALCLRKVLDGPTS